MTRDAPDNDILYVETLIAVDKTAIRNRQMTSQQRKNYILSLMNIVKNFLFSAHQYETFVVSLGKHPLEKPCNWL
jgi:hypothetical protein